MPSAIKAGVVISSILAGFACTYFVEAPDYILAIILVGLALTTIFSAFAMLDEEFWS